MQLHRFSQTQTAGPARRPLLICVLARASVGFWLVRPVHSPEEAFASMDRLLFGDNQFFGMNHMSEEKARAQAIRFQDLSQIISLLDAAHAEGISTFMCTTHERIADICDHWRAHPDRYKDYKFYPCMPYAHKYANAVTDHG